MFKYTVKIKLKIFPIPSHRQWKCTTCQKVMGSKLQLKFHNKMHTEAWNVSSMEADSSQKELISSSGLPSITTLDIRVDADSSVSEKVLMDAVAEKKSMDCADVSIIIEIFVLVYDILHRLYNV